jgi:hypothetical protein
MVGVGADDALALHTRARRYLIDRYRDLTTAYQALPNSRPADGYHYTEEALEIFPRYNVVAAMLDHVEAIDSDHLPDVKTLTGLLVGAAYEAQSPYARAIGPIPKRVMADERKLFADQVPLLAREMDSPNLLPYRRTLSEAEGQHWLDSLRARWGVIRMEWYPMLPAPVPEDVLVLRQSAFSEGGGEAALQAALGEMGVSRVLELREDLIHREMAVEWFSPTFRSSGEGLWTDESVGWIAYASHESTVAFAGAIRAHLQSAWSDLDWWRWHGWS